MLFVIERLCICYYTICMTVPLLATNKAFKKLHLDFEDIIFDQIFNDFIHVKMESLQCNVAIAITDDKRGTSTKNVLKN